MTFEDAGLHPAMAKNVELCQYKTPTPIQKYCLSAVRDGHDVIGIAQTGKTFPSLNMSHAQTNTISRLGKDGRLPHSHPQQANG